MGHSKREFAFYDNIFEYTDKTLINPSIMYFGFNTRLTITNCLFKNFQNSKATGGEGILFSVNKQLEFTFNNCTFINIGNGNSHFFKMNGDSNYATVLIEMN